MRSTPSAAEQVQRREGGGLRLQPVDQRAALDLRMRRDVEDRLLRVERGALAADGVERIDHHAAHPQHAALEDREEPDGPGADHRHVRLDRHA